MWEEVRHSQADKVDNNFHGQNPFQFYGQTLIFTAKTDVFVLRFLGLSPFHPNDKISCSIPVPFQWHNFMLKISNCKILCSTPFHSNWYLRPATPSWLPAVDSSPHWEQLQRQYFTNGLGLPGKLAEYLSKSNKSTCSWDDFSRLCCQRSGRLWQENWAASLLYHYQVSGATSCIPPVSLPGVQCKQLHPSCITTRCPVQTAACTGHLIGGMQLVAKRQHHSSLVSRFPLRGKLDRA